ncbi:MAG: enoyl-CoA hydratase/isomerase family protein [Acidimicrobiales bacterium]
MTSPSVTLGIDVRDDHVAVLEMQRPPHNFLNPQQVEELADALERFEGDPGVRAVVLCAEGRSFCAGAEFGSGERTAAEGLSITDRLYAAAVRLCAVTTPVVAAVQGPAIGGGLGLALTATMRVTCPEARFSANFVKLGIHQGFGISATLPALVGASRAAEILLMGRRYTGEQAVDVGLADRCVPAEALREIALEMAGEIASGAPLAIESIYRTLRAGLADQVRDATAHEAAEQDRLSLTSDAAEGIRAVAERRPGQFTGEQQP